MQNDVEYLDEVSDLMGQFQKKDIHFRERRNTLY